MDTYAEERRLLLPVYDTVILPDVDYRLNVGALEDGERETLEKCGKNIVIMPLTEEKAMEDVTPEICHEYGVMADVIEISEGRMGVVIHLMTHEKVRVYDIRNTDGLIDGCVEIVD